MKPEKLSQLLRNQKAIDALTIDELNALIDQFPYMQQLRDIKALKLEEFDKSGIIKNEAAIYNGGWSSDHPEEHEIIDLDDIIQKDSLSEESKETPELVSVEVNRDQNSDGDIEVESVILDEEDRTEKFELDKASELEQVEIEDLEFVESSVILEEMLDEVHDAPIENQFADASNSEDEVETFTEKVDQVPEEDEVIEEMPLEVDVETQEIVEHEKESSQSQKEDLAEIEVESEEASIAITETEVGDSLTETTTFKEEMASITSLEDLSENELIQFKKKKKKKKKSTDSDKKPKKKKSKKKKDKDKDSSKKKKKKSKSKKDDKVDKSKKKDKKKKKKKKVKAKQESSSKKQEKGSKEKKNRKRKRNKSKETFASPKSNYAAWLLDQQQISKKGKKRKKKKKTISKAMESIKRKKGIVSEPLAELLAAQGHVNQAKAMYNELSLIFPEKSTYFAAQIENLVNNK